MDALGEHLLARDDAVALQQQLGERAPALPACGGPLAGTSLEEGGGKRPASLNLLAAPAGAAPRTAEAGALDARATAGSTGAGPGRRGPGTRERKPLRAQRRTRRW